MAALWWLLAVAVAVAEAGRHYPLYKQCDPAWGSNPMGVDGPGERATICREGCAMSSLSMALAGLNVTLPGGTTITPGSLNAFLEKSQLYHCAAGDCNNLVLNAPEAITARVRLVGEIPTPSVSDMQAGLASGKHIYLAHVHNRGHFVLLTGYAGSNQFTVNDPFFNSTVYPVANISDVILYTVESDPATTWTPFAYPLYKQCDPRWGKDLIETETVCEVGCLMSSISMSLAGHSIKIAGDASNPGTLNHWLRTHNGYTSGNDLEESVVPKINTTCIAWPADGMHTKPDLPLEVIKGYLLKHRVVIANVMKGHHFVLVVGFEYENDNLLINDPGFDRETYSFSEDVVGWRLFDLC